LYTNTTTVKRIFLLLTISFVSIQAYTQALEMVERSWDIYGTYMDSAKVLAEKGYAMGQEEGDLKAMGRALAYRAIYYDIETKTDSALFLFYKALDIQRSIKDTVGLITTYNNMGIFHFSQYQYPQALIYYKKAYETAMLLPDYSHAAGSLINMGIIESYKPSGGDALNYYAEAERLYLLNGDSSGLYPIWSNTAKVYMDRNDFEKAYEFNLKSIQVTDDNRTVTDQVTDRILMTNILVKMQRFAEAEKYGLEGLAISQKNKLPERRQYIYEALANLYFQKNDFKNAYTYTASYRDLRDSLISDSKAQQIAEMETAYKVEKTNKENTQLKLDIEQKKNIELRKKRLVAGIISILIAAGIGLIILVIFILLLVKNLRLEKINTQLLSEKKFHAETLLEKEKLLMRESHHRIKNNLQLINSILDLQSRNIKDPTIKKAFLESRQRIQAISFAHQRLHGNDTVEKLNLKDFLGDLVQSIQLSAIDHTESIKINSELEDLTISTEKAIPIGLILNELLTNAIKYAFYPGATGTIHIHLKKQAAGIELIIEDNGKGMEEESQGTGFGHQLVKSMTRQLKAQYLLSLTSGVKHQFFIPV
jgi:two-component sensor histidine kinase/Tfp pilus assembly protein PilF